MSISHKDQSPVFDLLIGPLSIRIHGRLHPQETDPFDFDWLATSTTFKGLHPTTPGFPSFEAEELARFQTKLISLVNHATPHVNFGQTEPICAITARRRDDGQVDAEFIHDSGDSALIIVTDEDLRGWIDGLAAILRHYPPRTALNSIA